MANSSIIGKAKNEIIKALINDNAIINAIEPDGIESKEDLINTYIFNFHQNPNTINEVKTFITVQVHIPSQYTGSKILVNTNVEIWIISHEDHMRVCNVPKVKENRNDYLSKLIDEKLNGSTIFGLGKLMLKSNLEGAYQKNYLYRQLVFTVADINDSLCDIG